MKTSYHSNHLLRPPANDVQPPPSNAKHGLPRRQFLQRTGVALGTVISLSPYAPIAGPFEAKDVIDHFVPADKKLRPEWIRTLFAKGERTWYSGRDLDTIGMPVGGVCAGQVYLTGDGRLVYWDIFNQNINTGYGRVNYKVGRKPTETVMGQKIVEMPPLRQGAAIQVRQEGRVVRRRLDRAGFPNVRFCGEYPIGYVDFSEGALPVAVRLEAFSPFIPLNEADSALPATILEYQLRNTSDAPAEVTLVSWLENAVCRHSHERFAGRMERENRLLRERGATLVLGRVRKLERSATPPPRPPEVFADFEGGNYGDWKIEGEAFGDHPVGGTLPNQQQVSGFKGKGLVNTYLGGDGPTGKLTSPEFTIQRPWISFLIGGGGHERQTCINLVVDGKVVRTATGRNNERLEPHNWDVRSWQGRRARIEIVDAASGPWGHINIDQIEFRDTPMTEEAGELEEQADYGTMAVGVLAKDNTLARADVDPRLLDESTDKLFHDGGQESETVRKSPVEPLTGLVGQTITLQPGETRAVRFVVAWHMPNLRRGNRLVGQYYATRFNDAAHVVRYIRDHRERLMSETRLWHDTYYRSSLPHWLLDRLHSTVANLATTTCQWWRNGRFWAWEGCGCCHGTCGHVWNYEHAMARLFPKLERSVREMQDFNPKVGLRPNGAILFRGEDWGMWAGDAQGGYILKAYREHQVSGDPSFLKRNWPAIRKALEFLIEQDGDGNGLLEGSQHQTYDQNYFGPNTMVGSLYLGALRAGEEMARELGEEAFAATCRRLFERGSRLSSERLFNGEYFIQEVDLKKHPEWQYADGCLSDQLFGQGWAHQVRLGYLYPRDQVQSALRSVWKYNWAPDVGPQNKAHKPERWFAYPGEAGLFTCTWPKSKHLGPRSTRYRNEIWTGIEYQVAGHMVWEGMLTEALAICRGIHERYHPSKHNPWNEIECGDHYARALASWGVFTALAGFSYHGPACRLGMAPRLQPHHFRAAFTASEGWGELSQQQARGRQTNRIELRWGELRLKEFHVALPEGAKPRTVRLQVAGQPVAAEWTLEGSTLNVTFPEQRLTRDQVLELQVQYGA